MQIAAYTLPGLTFRACSLHNLCMPKDTESTIIRGSHAAEARIRLIAARKGHGWTQKQLAIETGWVEGKEESEQSATSLSPSRIANYEQGSRTVGPFEAEVFARAFDNPAPWFMGGITAQEAGLLSVTRGHKGRIYEPPEGLKGEIPLHRGSQKGRNVQK